MIRRVLVACTVAAAVAAVAPAAGAGGFAPCEPYDVQCIRNCGPQVDTSKGIKNIQIYTNYC
jgi:hypothetical protein